MSSSAFSSGARGAFSLIINLGVLLIALPVALPLMALIAAWIALETPGPVIHRSYRIGKGGRPIPVLKFRTMHANAEKMLHDLLQDPRLRQEWERYHKLSNDPRITPSGRWLRRTSLDELPQLFNVLVGQMNIVGPRPITEEELRRYPPPARRAYLAIRPGVTGLWQVKGRNALTFKERAALDACYVRCWSPCLDIWILWRTLFVVLSQTGAH
jgi:lipopolysaccharide/colanic/teichoic acid biosynthesis glycosyltransferase